MGTFAHACENELVCKSLSADRVPKFGSPIYLENKTQIGQVDEIFGPITEVLFTVKPASGFVATSFQPQQKVYINPMSLLPMKMFLEEPKGAPKYVVISFPPPVPVPVPVVHHSYLFFLPSGVQHLEVVVEDEVDLGEEEEEVVASLEEEEEEASHVVVEEDVEEGVFHEEEGEVSHEEEEDSHEEEDVEVSEEEVKMSHDSLEIIHRLQPCF
jgi:rRNA processing protein Gar1